MIIDAFIFFNELQLLEVRLNELAEVCDFFVIVEAAQTFGGRSKSYCFLDHKDRFSKFLHKIIYFQIPKLPPIPEDTESDRFRLEEFQRNRLFDAITHIPNVGYKDIVLISDVDEIPSVSGIRRAAEMLSSHEVVSFAQDHYRGCLQERVADEWALWPGTIAVKYEMFSRFTPNALRAEARIDRFDITSMNRNVALDVVDEGGWHLSYFGGSAAVSWKVASFAHGAPDSVVQYNREAIEAHQALGEECDDPETLLRAYTTIANLNGKVPKHILAHPQRYAKLIVG